MGVPLEDGEVASKCGDESGETCLGQLPVGSVWCRRCTGLLVDDLAAMVHTASHDPAEDLPIIITVQNRFRKANGREVCLTDRMEQIEPKPFVGHVAHVGRKYGVTINLENYESARVEVSITIPCYLPDIRKADKWAQRFIEETLRAEVATIHGSSPKSKDSGGNHSYSGDGDAPL